MEKDPESRSGDAHTADPLPSLKDCAPLVEWLYAEAKASRWGLSRGHFAMALERSVTKRWVSGALSAPKLEEYLRALHLEDLALATASRNLARTKRARDGRRSSSDRRSSPRIPIASAMSGHSPEP